MTSGATKFSRGFNLLTGLTNTPSGGTLAVTGGNTQVAISLTLSAANDILGDLRSHQRRRHPVDLRRHYQHQRDLRE